MMAKISKKICLVGDFSVGKTSLIRRFVDDQFDDKYLSTVGVKLSRKVVDPSEEQSPSQKVIELLIWDIEGRTQFKGIVPSYLQGATGAIIVADVKRQETLEHLQEHLELFSQINPKSVVIIALNKADLVEKKQQEKLLSLNQFSAYPQVLGSYATSAKTGEKVNQIFRHLATSLM